MKRSTPLRRTAFASPRATDEGGKRRYSTLARTPMKRTAMKRKLPRRLTKRAALTPYVRFVKSLACMYCQRPGPSDPAHMTLGPNEKGVGLKVDDRQCVPLCRTCHRRWDGHEGGARNQFRDFTKAERWALAAEWVAQVQLATVPTTYEEALDLENAGLGEVLREFNGFVWLPSGAGQ